jgi:YHS domain-containing protein/copper chaperone CopZ
MDSSGDSIAYLSIELDGTYCTSCVAVITSSLMKHQGVIKATVRPLNNSLIMKYDSDRISQTSLEAILQSTVVENKACHKSHSSILLEHHDELQFRVIEKSGDVIDPVCRMTVDTDTTELYSDFRGRRYFFCARSCKNAFDEDPVSYDEFQDVESSE